MGPGGVDWLSAVAALAAGIGAGGWLVWKMRATGAAAAVAPDAPLERRDLLGKRDALMRQLAELEDAAGKRSPAQLARERHALELEAARVLMAIDRAPAPAPGPATQRRERSSPFGPAASSLRAAASGGSALRGFLWSVGAMAALGGLVLLATQAAQPRPFGGPAGADVGPATTRATEGAAAPRLRELLERNPDDVDTRLALARELLEQGDMMGVWNETQRVLARSPGNPRALSYQAVVRLAMGQPAVARDMLEQAISAAPELFDAYASLALAHVRLGDRDAAARTMATAKQRFTAEVEELARFEAEMEASAEGPSLEDNPHASVGPPSGPAPAAPAPSAPASAGTATAPPSP